VVLGLVILGSGKQVGSDFIATLLRLPDKLDVSVYDGSSEESVLHVEDMALLRIPKRVL
jgi:hypothetical protein